MEAAWNYEWVNMHPVVAKNNSLLFPSWKDELWKVQISTNIERPDDTFVPRNGLMIHANYDKSLRDMYHDSRYIRMDVSLDFYRTLLQYHTLHVYGFYGNVEMDSLTNKFIVQGGPSSCVGVNYNQLLATTLSVVRLDYRFEFRKILFCP